MLSEQERAVIRTAVREIVDEEERRRVVELARRAAALEHRGSEPYDDRRAPLRMR